MTTQGAMVLPSLRAADRCQSLRDDLRFQAVKMAINHALESVPSWRYRLIIVGHDWSR